ncbi:family 43 glycosylhydrolase [Leifsonia shinshuensis]|uniref:family 43 glycosylhydrolase n=1 Tax=Leifsonia shinshuensis TaxID=150026 RepID=UPI001F50B536|nr:family 43 glycosylhydrolase [Leifsonia shinshuensis]MCI0157550.1 family 43 glycosylhydrolase [Leifsonia shinshuensis]
MTSAPRSVPDLGNGTFRNPVLPGDRPDPAVLRVGDHYYLTYSSFDASPGLTIWRSPDLVNWTFVTCALDEPLSTVFAPDFAEHEGRFYLYIPFVPSAWSEAITEPQIWVIHADSPEGPWSEPVFTGVSGAIDPGHVVGEDGRRYLFVNGIRRCRLSADGLHAVTPLEQAYDGWHYPDEWITEAYALEGPKLFRRGDWFYLVSAVGGTGGPATGHMVIVARARSVHGPWQNAPGNPIARTWSADEAWWSRGHATILDAPDGSWWMVSHGYANGYRTLGRQALLEPIAWSEDGWPIASAADVGAPLRKPAGASRPVAVPAPSDDFTAPAWGERWVFDNPGREESARARFGDGLTLRGSGTSPSESSPITTWAMDDAYEVEVEVEVRDGSSGGLLLYFNDRMFFGMGWDGSAMQSYAGGIRTHWREPAEPDAVIEPRLRNDRHIVTGWHRRHGGQWVRHGVRYDTSGAHSATLNDLKSLRPALFATGDGDVVFRSFQYRPLDGEVQR